MAIVAPARPREQEKTRTSRLPPYAVVVLNDDDHTYEYVIMTFQKVFGYDLKKSYKLADTIHKEGRAVVWVGSKEVAEFKKEQIESMGPDRYAQKTVNWPLGVELEPVA